MAYDERGRYVEDKREQSSPLASTLKVGALIGAGAVGFKYRRQIGRGLGAVADAGVALGAKTTSKVLRASKASEHLGTLGTTLKALNEATETGIVNAMRNPVKFEQRFQRSAIRDIEKRTRRSATPLGGESTQIEDAFFNLQRNVKHGEQMHIKALRYEKTVNQIKSEMPDRWEDSLQHILPNVRNQDFFDKPTLGKVKGFVEQYSPENAKKSGFQHSLDFKDDTERNKFIDTMFKALDDFKDTGLINKKEIKGGIDKDGVDWGYGTSGVRRDQYEAFKSSHSKEAQETWMSKVLARHNIRQATVEDILNSTGGKGGRSGAFDSDSIMKSARRQDLKDTDENHVEANIGRALSLLSKQDKDVLGLVADKNLFVNEAGDFIDLRRSAEGMENLLSGFRDNTQIPFLNFNPLDLMHWNTIKEVRNAPKTYFLRRGTIDPNLSDSVETVAHPMAHNQDATVGSLARDYMYTGDRVVDLLSGETVKDRVFLTSARFGMFPRMNAAMANLHRVDYGNAPWWKRIFGAEGQENENMWSRGASVLTKFDNPEWAPNTISAMVKGRTEGEEVAGALSTESAYKILHSQLDQKSTPLSADTVDYINQFVKQAYGKADIDIVNLDTPEQIMGTVGKLVSGATQGSSDVYGSQKVSQQLYQMWNQYERNQTEFLKNMRIKPDDKPFLPETFSSLDQSESEAISKLDDAKRLIHQHALEQVEHHYRQSGITVTDLVKEGINSGELRHDSLKEVRNLSNLTEMRQWWDDVYINGPTAKEDALEEFSNRLLGDDPTLRASIQSSMEDLNKKWAMGPGEEPPNYFGFVGYQTMTKGKGIKWALEDYNKQVTDGVNPLKAGASSALDVLKQPFAGRNNIGEVTAATAPFYYSMERLNNAISQLGLGLPQKYLGSTQSIYGNMLLRRVIAPYVAYQQLQYLDDLTGDTVSDQLADTYVNMHEDVGNIKEITGINRLWKDLASIVPGQEQIWDNPLGGIIKHATFGFLGDSRSGEEIEKYYESGEDPIRKGRWWGIGSNTPFVGGKIDRYEANWYRKMKSDYKYTDTMYGSASEYWANNWMPTLTHPFAPLKHYIFDSNHWEEKHAEDRPYAITGGFGELDAVPLIGPAFNNTIGRILKPRVVNKDLEKSHREYLEQINEYYDSQYDVGSEGAVMQGMPSGGFTLAPQGSEAGPYDGNPDTVQAYAGDASGEVTQGTIGNTGEVGQGTFDARMQLSAINTALGKVSVGDMPSMSSLESLRDPDVVADLKDVGTMHSVAGSFRDTFYSMGEVGGMYGFITKTMLGFDESGRGMTLDPSSRMTSLSRSWWDMELGGAGGQASEIFRRFLPRDPNKNYYNPIRNTMPDWLPGLDYYTDFKHGDPYVKIKHGEMRLPGEAYESLNELHPDAFGEYGAFDRMKILADVAPYSKEYKYYRRVVSQMNQQGLLTDEMNEEYATIRDQVSSKKDKYITYNRRFGNADVERKKVTIRRVIDANTFITEEFGSANPIKLAGVGVKSDDEETRSWLSQYIHEGATVEVELDADPMFRIRDDTFNTMRAVVYSGGKNLNYQLANGDHPNVTVKDDKSATATRALWSDTGITVGKLVEFAAHDVLPNLPVIGTLADKFYQVRTPLEQYKRNEVFGKAWRPWYDPIGGWIEPMLDQMASNNPIIGAAQGAGIGWLASRGSKTLGGRKWGKWIGGAVGGAVATTRVFREQFNSLRGKDEDWIPERRKKEREINEYFDKLAYVKYRGLYEKARQKAIKEEGVDIEELLGEGEKRGKSNKYDKREMEQVKKYLSMAKKMGYGENGGDGAEQELKLIRERLKGIDEDRPLTSIGPMALLALRYRAEMESTLYGADPSGDMTKIFRALPSKDREFFTDFMTAAPKDREEILRLVPKDQRRFYQAKWGLDVEKKESLQSYFANHYLPDENWSGWEAGTSLENIKVKVVRNEGIELTEFGLWGDDEKRADQSGAQAVQMHSIGHLIEPGRLEKVLKGAGLTDVRVSVNRSSGKEESKIDLTFDLLKDRTQDVIDEMNKNLGSIFG